MSKDDAVMKEGAFARLAALEDVEEIRTLKHRYAEAVDRCIDAPSAQGGAAVADFFTEDGGADFGPYGAPKGRAQIAEHFHVTMPSMVHWTRHFMMNPIIEVDGASAKARWYCLVHAVFKSAPSPTPQTLWVRYEDTYSKTEKGWRFRSALVHFDTPKGAS